MKKNIFFILLFMWQIATAQQVPDKAAPFTAVKWEGENPVVMLEGEWFTLKQIDGIDVTTIVAHCKKQYGNSWQKRFSEDLVEVLQGMGHTPKVNTKLTLIKNNATVQKTAAMTKENRQAVWQYNNEGNATAKQNYATSVPVVQPSSGSFKIKACKITYEYTGIVNGTDVFYFDDYGKVAVLEHNQTGLDGKHQTIIWKDGQSTIINHTRKSVATSAFRPKDTEPPTIAYGSEQQRKNEGYEKLDNETIAGKSCEVYKHTTMNVKYWLWNNIDLRLENYALGKNGYVKNAVKVEEISKIPDGLFNIPAGYK